METGQVISVDYMLRISGDFTILMNIGCIISTSWYMSCTWM